MYKNPLAWYIFMLEKPKEQKIISKSFAVGLRVFAAMIK